MRSGRATAGRSYQAVILLLFLRTWSNLKILRTNIAGNLQDLQDLQDPLSQVNQVVGFPFCLVCKVSLY